MMFWRNWIYALILFVPRFAFAIKVPVNPEVNPESSSSGGVGVEAAGLPISIIAMCIVGLSIYNTFFRRR